MKLQHQMPKPDGYITKVHPEITESQLKDQFITALIGFAKVFPFKELIRTLPPEKSSEEKYQFIEAVANEQYCTASTLLRKSVLERQDLVEWFQGFQLLGTLCMFAENESPEYSIVDSQKPLGERLHASFVLWGRHLGFEGPLNVPLVLSAYNEMLTNYGTELLTANLRQRYKDIFEAQETLLDKIEAETRWKYLHAGMAITQDWQLDPMLPWRDLVVSDGHTDISFRVFCNPRRAYTGTEIPKEILKIVEEWERG